MRMLVTRPEPDGQATLERLAALGIEATLAPLMVRRTLPAHLPPLHGFAALAISSTNALRALRDLGIIEDLLSIPVFAVGDRTAHEARLLGFNAVSAADGTLDSMVTMIVRARLDGPVLYPCGKHLSGDLAHALAPHGTMVATIPIYEMVAETELPGAVGQALASEGFGAVLLYSRRTAEIFSDLAARILPGERRRRLAVLCLSENVAQPLLENQFSRVMLADYPSEEAMMTLALAFAREQIGP